MTQGGRQLQDVVALVTGGGSGIGAATVGAFREAGAQVGALDLDPPRHEDVLPLQADVTDGSSVGAAVDGLINEFGRLDVLVNNAGIGAVGGVDDNDIDEWNRVFDVNVYGMVRVTQATLTHLRNSERPAIVNTASVAGLIGLPQRVCYSASKGAVVALTFAMAADLVTEGVRVNCVCPGTVDTPWVGRLLEQAEDPEAARSALDARQPMGRLATAQEIADAILYLAKPSSSFVTGTALQVDGGLIGLRIPATGRRR